MNKETQKEKARQQSKRYYQKNKERILKRQKEYLKNKLTTDREYLQKLRKQKREWAKKHRKELQEKGLTTHGTKYKSGLQYRINKAIEYINCKKFVDGIRIQDIPEKEELLNILKGDSDE